MHAVEMPVFSGTIIPKYDFPKTLIAKVMQVKLSAAESVLKAYVHWHLISYSMSRQRLLQPALHDIASFMLKSTSSH